MAVSEENTTSQISSATPHISTYFGFSISQEAVILRPSSFKLKPIALKSCFGVKNKHLARSIGITANLSRCQRLQYVTSRCKSTRGNGFISSGQAMIRLRDKDNFQGTSVTGGGQNRLHVVKDNHATSRDTTSSQ